MKPFVDNSGRTWTLSVNVGSVKRIKELAGIDVLGNDANSFIGEMADNPISLVNVIYAILKPQLDTLNISAEEFAEAISGDVIANATDALLEEFVNFFPNPKREIMTKILERTRKAEKEMLMKMNLMMSSPEIEEKIQEQIDLVLNSVTN